MPNDTREPTLTLRFCGDDAECIERGFRGEVQTAGDVLRALNRAQVLPEPRGWALVLASEADADALRDFAAADPDEMALDHGEHEQCNAWGSTLDMAHAAVERARLVQLDAPGDAGDVAVGNATANAIAAWQEHWRYCGEDGAEADTLRDAMLDALSDATVENADAIRREARAEGFRNGKVAALNGAIGALDSVSERTMGRRPVALRDLKSRMLAMLAEAEGGLPAPSPELPLPKEDP